VASLQRGMDGLRVARILMRTAFPAARLPPLQRSVLMQRISLNLWFDNQAEEAARFYTSIFHHSKIRQVTHYGAAGAKASGRPVGSVMTVCFEIDGQELLALNGGPLFKFNEAISLIVNCKNQDEIDEYWNKLVAGGGQPGQCGWLKDRYGVSWQVVPEEMGDWLDDKDRASAERVMEAMMGMTKLDMRTLKQAHEHAHAGH
jgi:predicted 3-demethylubiquinone-9 3-methyltransferase (glyoxalase superfamily)